MGRSLAPESASAADAHTTLISLQDSVCKPLAHAVEVVQVMQELLDAGPAERPSAAEIEDAMMRVSAAIGGAIESLHTAFSTTCVLSHDYEPRAVMLQMRELFSGAHARAAAGVSVACAPGTAGVSVACAPGTDLDGMVEIDPLPLRMAVPPLVRLASNLAGATAQLTLTLDLDESAGALRVRAHAGADLVRGATTMTHADAPGQHKTFVEACAHALNGWVCWGEQATERSQLATIPEPLPPFAELTVPVHCHNFIGKTLASFRLPVGATVVIVDDSRLTRTIVRSRVLAHLCVPGEEPLMIPPVEMRDDDPDVPAILRAYASTLAALVQAGPVILFSDNDLGVGVPTGAQVIQHVRATVPEAETNLVACVVSANGSTPDRRMYADLGADAFVCKTKDGVRHARQAIARACARRFGLWAWAASMLVHKGVADARDSRAAPDADPTGLSRSASQMSIGELRHSHPCPNPPGGGAPFTAKPFSAPVPSRFARAAGMSGALPSSARARTGRQAELRGVAEDADELRLASPCASRTPVKRMRHSSTSVEPLWQLAMHERPILSSIAGVADAARCPRPGPPSEQASSPRELADAAAFVADHPTAQADDMTIDD